MKSLKTNTVHLQLNWPSVRSQQEFIHGGLATPSRKIINDEHQHIESIHCRHVGFVYHLKTLRISDVDKADSSLLCV